MAQYTSNMALYSTGAPQIWHCTVLVHLKYGTEQYRCTQIWHCTVLGHLKYGTVHCTVLVHSNMALYSTGALKYGTLQCTVQSI